MCGESRASVFTPIDSMTLQQIYICDNILIENKDLYRK